ncbi:hypothetical protein [Streptosporangium subroseum]|uniref:hypothetical protein n=1 Tax=Streptosporangium subroseum TaxID=106412 RepID=UPI00309082EE|nr:hypothetical protein OHB15_03100 [Streptosporangium subroseum]
MSGADAVEVEEEMPGAAQVRRVPVRRRIGDEPRAGQASCELGQCEPGLQPGEGGAEAVLAAADAARDAVDQVRGGPRTWGNASKIVPVMPPDH